MANQEYNKLVRDKIPDIISENGRTPITRILNKDEYAEALQQKLKEEVAEYLESGEIEELADITEVIYALAKTQGIDQKSLEEIRIKKRTQRGGFDERIFLSRVVDE